MDELEDAREVEEVEEVEQPAAEAPTAETPPPPPELKVVLQLRQGYALVGVQGKDTDPVLEVVTGSLEEVLGVVPGLIEQARERWAERPRNPTYEGPPPATPSQPARRAPATPTAQPQRMF